MMFARLTGIAAIVACSSASVFAAQVTGNAPITPSGGMLQSLLGLLVVLAVIGVLAWLARRLPGRALGKTQHLRVIGQLALGTKERVSLLEFGDTWVLIGITPTQINTLHVMPKSVLAETAEVVPSTPFSSLLNALQSRKPNA
jgi:flagellar protein FliO/FliZ